MPGMRLPTIVQELYAEKGGNVSPGTETCIAMSLVPEGSHLASQRIMFTIDGTADLDYTQYSCFTLDAWWLPFAGSDLMQTPDNLAEIKTYYDRLVAKVDDTVPSASWTESTDPGTGAGGSGDGANEADTTSGDVDMSLRWQPGRISLMTLENPHRVARIWSSGRTWMGVPFKNAIPTARDASSGNAKFRAQHTIMETISNGISAPIHGCVAWILGIPADVSLAEFTEASLFPTGTDDHRRWETLDFLAPKYDLLGTNVYRHIGSAAGGTGNADEVRKFLVNYRMDSTDDNRKFKQTTMKYGFSREVAWQRRVQMPSVIKATVS